MTTDGDRQNGDSDPDSASPETGSDGAERHPSMAGDPEGSEGIDRDELLTEVRAPHGRLRWKWAIRVGIVAAVLGAIAGAISVFGPEWGLLPGIGAFVLTLTVGVVHALLLFRSWEYRVREDALYLERGVFTHVKTVVPFVRVQHIDTSRDPVDRLLGLSSLVVYTAGSRGADVTIPGLTPGAAEDLQDRLKVLAKDSTGDDAV